MGTVHCAQPTRTPRAYCPQAALTASCRSAVSCALLPCRYTKATSPFAIQKLYRETTGADQDTHALPLAPVRRPVVSPARAGRVVALLHRVVTCHRAPLCAHSAVSRPLECAQAMPPRPCVTIQLAVS